MPEYSSRFLIFFNRLIGEEGGYVDDPADHGGETKFGISKTSYPKEDIKALTRDRAQMLYHRDFYIPLRVGSIADDKVAWAVFDAGVNCGIASSAKMLQEALFAHGIDIDQDGLIGPETLGAANHMKSQSDLLITVVAVRLARYLRIALGDHTQKKFLAGWTHRALRCLT